jgi:hypothetical protein
VSKLVTGESLLDLFFAGNRIYHYASGRGLLGNKKIIEILALIQPTTESSFAPVSRAVLKYRQLLSGCVLIFNCLDSERLDFLNTLKANGIATAAFLVADTNAASPGVPVHLVDPGNIQASLNKAGQIP